MMDEQRERLTAVLRASGRPVTAQRVQLWEALHAAPDHPTATELHARCPHLPLATVYNTLELFVALGLAQPLALEGGVRYDLETSEHVHVICTECGRLDDVALGPPASMEAWVRHESGYELSYPHMIWYGRCPRCAGGVTGE